MAKISANNSGPFKDKKGYSRIGGVLKSDVEKQSLEKKQTRLNAYSPAQNAQATAVVTKNKVVPKKEELNDYGAFKGGQKFKAAGRKNTPRFRQDKE